MGLQGPRIFLLLTLLSHAAYEVHCIVHLLKHHCIAPHKTSLEISVTTQHCSTVVPHAGELAGLAPEWGGEEKGEITDDSDASDFDGDDSVSYK